MIKTPILLFPSLLNHLTQYLLVEYAKLYIHNTLTNQFLTLSTRKDHCSLQYCEFPWSSTVPPLQFSSVLGYLPVVCGRSKAGWSFPALPLAGLNAGRSLANAVAASSAGQLLAGNLEAVRLVTTRHTQRTPTQREGGWSILLKSRHGLCFAFVLRSTYGKSFGSRCPNMVQQSWYFSNKKNQSIFFYMLQQFS